MLYTGLRIGEFLALMWTDVDMNSKTQHIHRIVTKGEKGEMVKDTTKTKRDRILPIGAYIKELPHKGLYLIRRKDGRHHTHRINERLYKQFFRI